VRFGLLKLKRVASFGKLTSFLPLKKPQKSPGKAPVFISFNLIRINDIYWRQETN
jgi:hypothetical protein